MRRARRGRSPTPMRRAYCVGCCGGSSTATAIPSAKAACPGASSSARTWARAACGQRRSGCGRKGMSTASAASAGGPGPARTGPAKGCALTGLTRMRSPTRTRRAPRSTSPCGTSSRRSSRSWGTSAGCRAAAAAAHLLGRRSVPPGTGGGTGSGGSTRSPWPPKPPKAPGAEPQSTAPNGPMAVTDPATPPLATSWKSPSRPRPSPVRCP